MRGAWQATIVDDEGSVQPFASVEVRDQNGALVPLFDEETGGSSISNPFSADSEGFARFYCDPQLVDIEATTATGVRSWDNVLIPGNSAYRDVIGTVSEDGGEPTGAIIESGENSNGSFVKFADGTMICSNRIIIGEVKDFLPGDTGGITLDPITYPESFVDDASGSISVGVITDGAGLRAKYTICGIFGQNEISRVGLGSVISSGDGSSTQEIVITYLAKGRWY